MNENHKCSTCGFLIDAITLLTEAISLDDQQATYFYRCGLRLMGIKKIRHGINDFEQAAELKV